MLRSELILCKKQINDMKATNLFLKKEKLKAEHERNLSEIRIKQLEENFKKILEHSMQEKVKVGVEKQPTVQTMHSQEVVQKL